MPAYGGAGHGCPIWHCDTDREPEDFATPVPAVATDNPLMHFCSLPGHGQAPGDFCWVGSFRGQTPEDKRRNVECLLKKLERRMVDNTAGLDEFNPEIPAGYTYLGQLLAHDIVMSEVSLAGSGMLPSKLRNQRTEPLMLETVYGGGLAANELAYSLEEGISTPRIRLRLGRARTAPDTNAEQWPFRDIARAAPAMTNDLLNVPAATAKLRSALIADQRNDDNFIITQLLVLFTIAHNALCAKLGDAATPGNDGLFRLSRFQDKTRLFRTVRRMMVRLWHRIIIEDYLKHVLHASVYQAYSDQNWACQLSAEPDGRIPVEFTHGAFRMGHAMVRDRYALNDVAVDGAVTNFSIGQILGRTSGGREPDFPFDASWIVKWSMFFGDQQDGSPVPQASRKIRPAVVPQLSKPVARKDFSLIFRDLVSAMTVGTRSAASLTRQFRSVFLDVPEITHLLDVPGHGYEDAIRRWLDNGSVPGLEAQDVEDIAINPPLPFFVLFEAEQQSAGARLGVVGSIIIAETVAAALSTAVRYVEDDEYVDHWEAATGLAEIRTMPQFCKYLQNMLSENDESVKAYGLDIVGLF